MKTLFTILFGLFSVAITSCKSTTESAPPDELLPLKEGNQWIYEVKTYTDSGIVKKISYDTLRVGSEFFAKGILWHNVRGSDDSDYFLFRGYYVNQNNGVWNFDTSSQRATLPYKYPSYASNSYVEFLDTASGANWWRREVSSDSIISINEVLTTSLGHFTCYHYLYTYDGEWAHSDVIDGTSFSRDIYFAPKIGVVKITVPMEVWNGNPNGFYMTSELIKYSLN